MIEVTVRVCTAPGWTGAPGWSPGTARELRYRTGTPVPSGMGSPCAVRGCGSARRTLAPPRPAIHLQDGKGDPSHLLFMVYVHELTTCALTAVDRQGSYFSVHAVLLCLLDLS